MKRFRGIIQSVKAPSILDLWITNGKLKYFNGGWKDLGGNEQILWDDIQEKPEFAAVATTGSYNDLSNKPTIPSAYTLPVATASVLGGVLMANSVADLEGTEDTAAICEKINSLLSSLRASGVLNL